MIFGAIAAVIVLLSVLWMLWVYWLAGPIPLYLKLFCLMFIQYGLLTVNTTAISHGNYLWTFLSDMALSLLGFTILKEVVESKAPVDRFAYALGGSLGAQLAIFLGHSIK